MFYFYILRCKDKTLYCGISKDIQNRLKLHNSGKGSKYVWAHGGGKLVHKEKFKTIGNALRREMEVKTWPRSKKLRLVNPSTLLLRRNFGAGRLSPVA